jgi:uncharacterized protein (DUF2147 family)
MVPLLLAMAAVQAAPDSSAAASPVGTWANPSGSVIVEIAACGDSELCGRVRWASDKAKADARKHGTDPLIGTELLHNFVPSGTDRWRGILFVPDLKRTSKADLQQLAPDRIKIRGCAVGRALCKSQIWARSASSEPAS